MREEFLKKTYFTLKERSSFANATALYRYGKEMFPEMTLDFVRKWLGKQFVHLIHRQTKTPKDRQYAKYVSTAPGLSIGIYMWLLIEILIEKTWFYIVTLDS